jgi:uncharacterized protein YbjT (DUF2867 family)
MNMKALVAGSTGLIGELLVKELLADDRVTEVEVLVRKPGIIGHPKLRERVIDFSNILNLKGLSATHVFCCLGTTIKKAGSQQAFREVDYRYVADLAALAARSGCSNFTVVSSVGADAKSGNFYLRTKGEMEEAVKNSGIPSVVIMRPSMLLGNRTEFRFGESAGKWVMKGVNPLLLGSWTKYRAVEAAAVARAMQRVSMENTPGTRIVEWKEMIDR